MAQPLRRAALERGRGWPILIDACNIRLGNEGAVMAKRKRGAALDAALKDMFKRLEDRGVPEHLTRIVDQLEEGGEATTPSREPPPSRKP